MANLEQLPAEVFAMIAKHIWSDFTSNRSLASLAATSRQCQLHAESVNFEYLSINQSKFPKFREILCSRRFRALRRLHLLIQDPHPPEPRDDPLKVEAPATRASAKEYGRYRDVIASALTEFLTILREKSGEPSDHPGISLLFESTCTPLEKTSTPTGAWLAEQFESELNSDLNVDPDDVDVVNFELSLRRAWVKLPENICDTDFRSSAVTEFHSTDNSHSLWKALWPASWSTLLACFPSLSKVNLRVCDYERKATVSRREARDEFGKSLQAWPAQLRNLDIQYVDGAPGNHFRIPPRLVSPELGYDILSHELGKLSQRLRRLNLHSATLDIEEFFRSGSQGGWPHLQELEFTEMQIASANGDWYFDREPRVTDEQFEEEVDRDERPLGEKWAENPHDDYDAYMDYPTVHFRTLMNSSSFSRIYVHIAEAVSQMPALLKLQISFEIQPLNYELEVQHEFYFTTRDDLWTKKSSAELKVGWSLLPYEEIPADVVEAWKALGAARNAPIDILVSHDPFSWNDFNILEPSG